MIHLLTPDRNDRRELLEHCKWQVSRFWYGDHTVKHWIINEAPRTDKPDLTARVQRGYNWVKENPDDWVFIVENDDFYPDDYLKEFVPYLEDYDFIGSQSTVYYNLRNRTWELSNHPNHSSLFCTAFRIGAMADFKWHMAHPVFLDIDIWRHAKKYRRKFIDVDAIGIKHGLGLCGGKGHQQRLPNHDPELEFLESRVDSHSFEFYSILKVHQEA